jgi:hypothetical protein
METMFAGYTDQLKKRMEPYIGKPTLAEGLRAAVAEFNKRGWDMDVVDISNKGMDAALEIQKVCRVNDIHKEFGFESPCFLICAPDGPAIREAFPELKVKYCAGKLTVTVFACSNLSAQKNKLMKVLNNKINKSELFLIA